MPKTPSNHPGPDFSLGTALDDALLCEDEIKEPPMFRVVMHNDDYTSMHFVVSILMEIFRKNSEDANKIMLDIHNKGFGECGVYTSEIAETKVMMVRNRARAAGFPLLCTMEPV